MNSNDYFDSLAKEWDDNPHKVARASATVQAVKRLAIDTHTVIDFGCGTGLLGLLLASHFDHVHLADSSCNMLDVARQKIAHYKIENAVVHQISSLIQLDVKADAITVLMVLHHIPDTQTCFQHAFDRLQPGGVLIVGDLFTEDGSFHRHIKQFDGHNGFDTQQLIDLAIECGFSVTQCEHYFDVEIEDGADRRTYPMFLLVAQKPK
ncbi:methyltransferase domain-containing protein [Vibrio sp. CAIM 722]|uniref:Methyltransferase domain-containing protein n=1 Tax=Vibrio eleionomae TaxID=2653505 RepID=A0A7X4RUZ5_9VIBR|nr:class I SAM-dependent methyltransferase [Vibrio eleionomae]MZI93624.1 methyltransferase domain-containing protein [Vibrio eleionomae]